MDTRGSLRYVIMRTGGLAGSARRHRPPGTSGAQAARGILVPALVLASLGAAGAALPGHGVAGAGLAAHPARAVLAAHACRTHRITHVSGITGDTAWMYAVTARATRPVISPDTAWMYGITNRKSAEPAASGSAVSMSAHPAAARPGACTLRAGSAPVRA